MPQKSFVVLGVSHRVQGEKDFRDSFDDPVYREIVNEIISNDHIDFVGEEAGRNTAHAERITQRLLGAGRYLNVDPLGAERVRYGIGETYFPPRVDELPVDRWAVVENEKREQIWVDQLAEKTTTRGLLICGFYHAFSVAAKLLSKGFEVEVRTYMPWNKLARGVA
jgi:hypothetical protein